MSSPLADQTPALRKTLGAFLTGVTVVTTTDGSGRPRGMTANSFTSVSLDPPMVLICVDRNAASCEAFRSARGYVVHILGAHQREVAIRFASKDPNKFDGLATRAGVSGAPILRDAIAWLDCVTEQIVDAGDHIVLIARVEAFHSDEARPLGFHQGKYVSFDPELDIGALRDGQPLSVGWVAECDDGRVVVERKPDGSLGIPLRASSTHALTDEALAAQAAAAIGTPADVQFLYSMYARTNDLALVYRAALSYVDEDSRPSEIELYAESGLPWDDVTDRSEYAILRRYFRERVGPGFGIYAGTEARGTVAMVSSPYVTPSDQPAYAGPVEGSSQ